MKDKRTREMLRMKKAGKRSRRTRMRSAAARSTTPPPGDKGNSAGQKKLDIAGVAELFISYCKTQHGLTDLVYDPKKRIIKAHDGRIMWLDNLYKEYYGEKSIGRNALFDQYAKAITMQFPLPTTFDEAKDKLFPVLKNRWMDQLFAQSVPQQNGAASLTQPLTENLHVKVVYDSPETVCHISLELAKQWGVDAGTIFATAMENQRLLLQKRILRGSIVPLKEYADQAGLNADLLLAKMRAMMQESNPAQFDDPEEPFPFISKLTYADLGFAKIEAYPGLYGENNEDWYSPSRILIPDWIRVLELQGDPVAMITHGGMLLVTGSENPKGLRGMAEIAKSRSSRGHGVSQIPIRLTVDGWRIYQPDSAHPAYPLFHDLYMKEVADVYNSQRQLLQRDYPGFVAECMSLTSRKDGRLMTTCVWVEALSASLLPKTDFVNFMAGKAEEATYKNNTLFVPWESVVEIVGHRMETTEYSPSRFRVTSFPSADEIERLATKIPREYADIMASIGSRE